MNYLNQISMKQKDTCIENLNKLRAIQKGADEEYIQYGCELLEAWLDEIIRSSTQYPDSIFGDLYSKGMSENLLLNSDNINAAEIYRSFYFLILYMYAYNFEITLKTDGYSDSNALAVGFTVTNVHLFPSEHQVRAENFRAGIILNVGTKSINSARDEIESVAKSYLSRLQSSVDSIAGWDAKLEDWNTRADNLSKRIEGDVQFLNFAGLSKGFKSMIDSKESERKTQVIWMRVFGFLISAALIYPVIHVLTIGSVPQISSAWVVAAAPFVAVEFMLLYFFRIFVKNFYSVKAQLLQLDLRYSICAFIQEYGEFAQNHRGSGDKTFERFESLIFSGITADFENIPGQFDGLEQIMRMVKELKS
jgi:hypothetical protein